MGRECVCCARFSWIEKDSQREGKALLEDTEILFRGDPRVKLLREDITEMVVRGEELVVTSDLGKARFLLGAAESAKWAKRFLFPPSLRACDPFVGTLSPLQQGAPRVLHPHVTPRHSSPQV